jgi:hypothetical protein
MLYREIIAVCSEIHTKHINTVCGKNAELLNVRPGDTYSDHWAFKGLIWLYTEFTYSTQFQPLYIPNPLQTQTQSVPRSKHSVSVIKTSQLML